MGSRTISGPGYQGDDGRADPRLAAALAGYADSHLDAQAVLAALSGSRLLVSVVARLTEPADTEPADTEPADTAPDEPHREKTSEIAVATLVGKDGRRALPAFTSVETLARWRRDARPVPAETQHVCLAALQEDAAAVVVDVAGPVPFVIEGESLRALAEGRDAPPAPPSHAPYDDPRVLEAVRAAVTAEPAVVSAAVVPGDASTDLTVRLVVAPGQDEEAAARRLAERLKASGALHGRLRRGLGLAVVRR